MPLAKQTLLKDTQKKWLAYRNAELKFEWKIDPNQEGTLQLVNADGNDYERLKKRVLALEAILE